MRRGVLFKRRSAGRKHPGERQDVSPPILDCTLLHSNRPRFVHTPLVRAGKEHIGQAVQIGMGRCLTDRATGQKHPGVRQDVSPPIEACTLLHSNRPRFVHTPLVRVGKEHIGRAVQIGMGRGMTDRATYVAPLAGWELRASFVSNGACMAALLKKKPQLTVVLSWFVVLALSRAEGCHKKAINRIDD